jgi:3'-5' exoribonuclease
MLPEPEPEPVPAPNEPRTEAVPDRKGGEAARKGFSNNPFEALQKNLDLF